MLRRIKVDDCKTLFTFLAVEGISIENMCFFNDETWLIDNGADVEAFFSFRIEEFEGLPAMPYISHFFVARDMRSIKKARELAYAMVKILVAYDFRVITTSVDVKDKRTPRFLKYFFGCKKPYAIHDGQAYYLMEVYRGEELSTATAAA